MSFPIAIAQSAVGRDIATNAAHIMALMTQAGERGARLVHFPECALSGYVKSEILDWHEVDWARIESALVAIGACARRLRLWAVIGCAHDRGALHRPHNSLYVISDSGEILGRYDKRRCSHTEMTDWFLPGALPCVFEVDGFRFGCCVCIEIQFPELFAEYERKDVDCVLLSSYSTDLIWLVLDRAHAATTCMWVSQANIAACAAAVPSRLLGPNGSVLAQAGAAVEILMGTLNREAPAFDVALTKARPWRRLARAGDIHAARLVS